MGLFTRDKSKKTQQLQQQQQPQQNNKKKLSRLDPPDLHVPSSSSYRQNGQQSHQRRPYNHPVGAVSQPQLHQVYPQQGYLPPPGWGPRQGGSPSQGYFHAPYQQQQQPAMIVNHHYHLPQQSQQQLLQVPPQQQLLQAPPQQQLLQAPQQQLQVPPSGNSPYGSLSLTRLTSSMANLSTVYDSGVAALGSWTGGRYDEVARGFDRVMDMIDGEELEGDEGELTDPLGEEPHHHQPSRERGMSTGERGKKSSATTTTGKKKKRVGFGALSGNYFAKVDAYANSKLPTGLPPLILTMPTWPLVTLAAQHSLSIYTHPSASPSVLPLPTSSSSCPTSASLSRTRVTLIPNQDTRTVIVAIRGTASFSDWAVNLQTSLSAPDHFLADAGNLCHGGFLSVARGLVGPIAGRLAEMMASESRSASNKKESSSSRTKREKDTKRNNRRDDAWSLLFTGHSAGGAVASLLYAHMNAPAGRTPLADLASAGGPFRRVHCITFGAPPVSLLPLQVSSGSGNSLFFGFVNEGDPVARADRAYVRSLLECLGSSPPKPSSSSSSSPPPPPLPARTSAGGKPARKKGKESSSAEAAASRRRKPTWPVPECTLSNAGRIIVLRSGLDVPSAKAYRPITSSSSYSSSSAAAGPSATKKSRTIRGRVEEGVVAQVCSDGQLRGQIWGDPVAHMMKLYAARVEVLAVAAVMGGG